MPDMTALEIGTGQVRRINLELVEWAVGVYRHRVALHYAGRYTAEQVDGLCQDKRDALCRMDPGELAGLLLEELAPHEFLRA